MSRVHVTSKRTSIPSERVDCRKHEIGPVLDVKVCLHQRRYGIEIMVESLFRVRTVSWVGIAKGIDKYVNRSVRNHFSWKRWAQSYRETCCESRATTNAYCDTVSYFYSCSWKKLDRYEPREIPSRLFYSVRSHDQITATWSINSSRRWWSSTIWLTIFLKKSRQSSMVLRWLVWQREEDPRKGFNIAWTLTFPSTSCISEQFRDIQEVTSLILHCKTMYRYRKDLPSTSSTSGTPMNWIQSSEMD